MRAKGKKLKVGLSMSLAIFILVGKFNQYKNGLLGFGFN